MSNVFFFQAEDGIRDIGVTGVQTCALPIFLAREPERARGGEEVARMTTLWLVRHGVTSHTGHKLSGWMPDVHLTDEGRAQADAAAELLSTAHLEAVYSSPIDRTRETAAAIAARHGLPVRTRRNIGEVEYGKWTNRSFKVLARRSEERRVGKECRSRWSTY